MSDGVLRVKVIAADSQYGTWLGHRIEAARPDASVVVRETTTADEATLEAAAGGDLLVLVQHFAPPVEGEAAGFTLLSALRAAQAAPILVVAEDGNELTALAALRGGAGDYLPRRLLNPERLAASITRCAGVRAATPPAEDPAPAPTATPTAAPVDAPVEVPSSASPGAPLADAARPGSRRIFGEETAGADDPTVIAPSARRERRLPGIERRGTEQDRRIPGIERRGSEPDRRAAPVDRRAPPPRRPAAAPAAPGTHLQIPRYTILHKLGESPRSTVYLANSEVLGHNVALKVSRVAEPDADSDAEPQFAQEYSALTQIEDPRVVEIYDYGTCQGREYIAMEYFPCGDLKARLQNPISVAQAVAYLQRVAGALEVVHSAGLVHRDLKPANVMLREDGSVVLIDFGLARGLRGSRSTVAGTLRGSPYYMSPEQAQGSMLDVRSDLYSLGVIFYEMLTGRRPYRGSTALEVLSQHVQAPVPELPADLGDWQHVIDGLMAKQRDARFPSAHALLEQLAVAA